MMLPLYGMVWTCIITHTRTLPKAKQARRVPLKTRGGAKEKDWGEGGVKEQPREFILCAFFWKCSKKKTERKRNRER